jgi:hypothetical protein
MPQVAEKAHVFVPFAACATVTVFVYRVLVWLPDSAAENVKLYFVPLMVRLPLLLALDTMV